MKNPSYLFIIFATGLLFSCSSLSEDEKILLGYMKDRMNNLTYKDYKESKMGDTVIFEVADKGFLLKGKLSWIGDYEVVTLNETDKDSSRYLSAIFAKENGVWQSVFENDLEPGKLDTILDLNRDNKDEIIMQYYKRNATGFECKLVVYAKKEGQKYLPIGDIAPNYYRNANNKASSTIELLQEGNNTKLFVNTLEPDTLEKNKEIQNQISYFYSVTPLGELKREWFLILCNEPLLFMFNKDMFYGIQGCEGNVNLNKVVNFMDGPADILTSSKKIKEVLPAEYGEILASSEGLIPVANKGYWGFVNLKGELVVKCKYTRVSKFENGKAIVEISDALDWRKAYLYIDTKGKELGLFFNEGVGRDCIQSILSETVTLRNCPNGVMYYSLNEVGNSENYTFYPNASIEDIISRHASEGTYFSDMSKKYNGKNAKYVDENHTLSIKVDKDSNGAITKVSFEQDLTEYVIFYVQESGVMVNERSGE